MAKKKKPAKSAAKKPAKKIVKKAVKKAAKTVARKLVKSVKPTKTMAKRKAAPAVRTKAAPVNKGLISVAPGFTANDLAKSMAWYQDILGFTVGQKWESDGQLRGAEMRRDGVSINLGQDDWKMGHDRAKGTATRMYIAMGPSIEDYANGITGRGGVLSQPLSEGWGMKSFGIDDPDGFKLTFFFRLS